MAYTLLSIIVPIYNVAAYLRRCIDSIIKQNFNDYELILIDDGSTDGSGIICNEYAVANLHVRTFHKTNGGVSSARNLGINKANGKYVWFVDPDDYITEDSLAPMSHLLATHSCDVYEFPFLRNGKKQQLSLGSFKLTENKTIVRFFVMYPKFHLWNKIIKRETIGDARYIEGISIGEDFLFLCSIFDKAKTYMYCSLYIYNYFDGRLGSAMTASTSSKRMENINSVFTCIYGNRRSYRESNYSAFPSVFLNRKNVLRLADGNSLKGLSSVINSLSFRNIAEANCPIKGKILLLIAAIILRRRNNP